MVTSARVLRHARRAGRPARPGAAPTTPNCVDAVASASTANPRAFQRRVDPRTTSLRPYRVARRRPRRTSALPHRRGPRPSRPVVVSQRKPPKSPSGRSSHTREQDTGFADARGRGAILRAHERASLIELHEHGRRRPGQRPADRPNRLTVQADQRDVALGRRVELARVKDRSARAGPSTRRQACPRPPRCGPGAGSRPAAPAAPADRATCRPRRRRSTRLFSRPPARRCRGRSRRQREARAAHQSPAHRDEHRGWSSSGRQQ